MRDTSAAAAFRRDVRDQIFCSMNFANILCVWFLNSVKFHVQTLFDVLSYEKPWKISAVSVLYAWKLYIKKRYFRKASSISERVNTL